MSSEAALVLRARGGDELAFHRLVKRHGNLIDIHLSKFFPPSGTDKDDLRQEGLLGFHKAVRDFRPDRGSGFRNFASLCVERQIVTAVKTATRAKHRPLNEAASLTSPLGDEDNLTLGDVLPNIRADADPLDHLIASEEIDSIILATRSLSALEREACLRYAEGYSYDEIAEREGVKIKTVDNAMQRAQRKIAAAPRRFRPMRGPVRAEPSPPQRAELSLARWGRHGVRKPHLVERACELRAQGRSFAQIARELRICMATASHYVLLAAPHLYRVAEIERRGGRRPGGGAILPDAR